MREPLVFAARRAPYPLNNGARIRANRLIRSLCDSFEVTLLTFEHHPRSGDGYCSREKLERVLPEVQEVVTVPGIGPRKRLRQARTLFARHSWSWGRYYDPAFGAALRAAVDRTGARIVHLDELGPAMFGPIEGAFSVYGSHNIEHLLARSEAEASRGVRWLFATVEARKIAREERDVWRRMPLSLAVSEHDAEIMRAGGARRVEVCPNGTDQVTPAPFPALNEGEPVRILFVGSGRFRPYERGVRWLVREVLPRVRAQAPVALDVVGRRPQRPASDSGVRYAGVVPSVESWYEDCHAVAVPVFEGSGTRLKVIEAMAYGRPVVSTALGVQGLPVKAPEHFVQAEDAAQFTGALVDLAERCRRRDPELQAMLERARAAITPLFWPRIGDRLVELYRRELDRFSAAG